MEVLIKTALSEAMAELYKMVPQTKKETRTVCISQVYPVDVATFIEKNNIPEEARFHNGSVNDNLFADGPWLVWEVDVATTDADRQKYMEKRFTHVAFKSVHKLLLETGYRRVGFSTALLKEFRDTSVYGMYQNKEWDRLIWYYSLYFDYSYTTPKLKGEECQ